MTNKKAKFNQEQIDALVGRGSKSTRMHGALNHRGWAFTYHSALTEFPLLLFVDTFSERVQGYHVVLLIDVQHESGLAYLTKTSPYKCKGVPPPVLETLSIKFRPGVGGVAWANDVEKAFAALKS